MSACQISGFFPPKPLFRFRVAHARGGVLIPKGSTASMHRLRGARSDVRMLEVVENVRATSSHHCGREPQRVLVQEACGECVGQRVRVK